MRKRLNTPATTPARGKTRPPSPSSIRPQPVAPRMEEERSQEDAPDAPLTDIETEEERAADSMETLPEMEREIGMSDWIDPQTGEPAEGQSPPHLEEE